MRNQSNRFLGESSPGKNGGCGGLRSLDSGFDGSAVCDEQTENCAGIRQKEIAQIRRSAKGKERAKEFELQPSKCNFFDGSIHADEVHAQVPFLKVDWSFDNFLEQLLVTIPKSLMDGRFGIGFLERGMVITAGSYVTERRNVGEAPETTGDIGEPLGDILLNDALILCEAFEGVQLTLLENI
jgi:hypothetical protein